jgi:hypothetical protein
MAASSGADDMLTGRNRSWRRRAGWVAAAALSAPAGCTSLYHDAMSEYHPPGPALLAQRVEGAAAAQANALERLEDAADAARDLDEDERDLARARTLTDLADLANLETRRALASLRDVEQASFDAWAAGATGVDLESMHDRYGTIIADGDVVVTRMESLVAALQARLGDGGVAAASSDRSVDADLGSVREASSAWRARALAFARDAASRAR